MTQHLISDRHHESAAAFFTRVAREKPPTLVPCAPCAWCGGDHRGPREFWPIEERELHEAAERDRMQP